jgi:hypothetical protein
VNGRVTSGDPPAPDDSFTIVEDCRLTRRDCAKRLKGADYGRVMIPGDYLGKIAAVSVADFHKDPTVCRGWVFVPVGTADRKLITE